MPLSSRPSHDSTTPTAGSRTNSPQASSAGSPTSMRASSRWSVTDGATSILSFRLPPGIEASDLPRLDGELVHEGLEWRLPTVQPTRSLNTLTSWAVDRGVEMPSLAVNRPSLEDTYLELITPHVTHETLMEVPA